MSGPNLSLGVSVAGLEQLNALRTAIAETKAELAALSSAGTSLQGLQRAAQTADKVGDDFTALRGDVQKLAGAFDSLAGSIKTSLAAISTAAAESTAGVTKQLKRQEEQAQKTAANLVANAKFAAMATRAQARTIISARSQLDFGIDEATVAKRFGDSAVASAKLAESLQTLKEAHYQSAAATKQSGNGMSVFSKQANDAVAAVEKITKAQAAVTNKTIRGAAGSEAQTRLMLGTNLSDQGALASMRAYYDGLVSANRAGVARLEAEYQKSIAALEKNVSNVMQAATRTGYQPADRAWWDKVIANQDKAQAKLDAAYAKSIAGLEKQVDKVMKAATVGGYTNAGPAWWNQIIAQQEAAQAKLDKAYAASIVSLERQVDKVVKAATRPGYTNAGPAWWNQVLAEQEAGIAKIQAANARFAALNDRGQARTVISARAQLDQGTSVDDVKGRYGEAAVAAARTASSLTALKEAHYASTDAGQKNASALSVFAKNANDAHSAARGLASGFNAMWLTWGNLAPLLAGAAVSNAVVQVGKVGSQVSYQLEFVKQLNDESATTIQATRERLRELSKDSLFSLDQGTKGLTGLVQAGLSAAEAMQVLPAVMNLATVGEMDLKTAGEGLIGIMNAFGIPMEKAAVTADKFGKAQQLAQVGVDDYIKAMQYASTVAGQYNQDLDNSFAAITLLGKINIKSTQAGTSYRNFLKDLYDPSVKAKRAMEELGVAAFDAAGKQRPFITVMQELKAATDPLTEEGRLKALGQIFSERGGKTAVSLLSDMTGQYASLNEKIKDSEGYNKRVADALQGQVGPAFKQAFNAMNASMDEVFQSYEANYKNVAVSLKSLFNSDGFKSSLGAVISTVGTLTQFLIDHHSAILTVVQGYIAWKAASFLVDVLQGISKAVIFATMNTRLWAASMGEASIASKVLTTVSSTAALTEMGTAAAMGATGMAKAAAEAGALAGAMPLLTRALGFVANPVVGLIALLGTLGATWWAMSSAGEDASGQLAKTVVKNNRVIEGSIDAVIQKERERRKLIAEPERFMAKDMRELDKAYDAQYAVYKAANTKAQELTAATPGVDTSDTGAFRGGVQGKIQGETAKATAALAEMKRIQAERAKIANTANEFERQDQEARGKREAEARRIADAAARNGTETFDGSAPKSSKGAYRLDNAEISAVERTYKDQEKLLTDYFSQQRALIDAQKKYRLATEVEAATSLEMLTRANYAQLEKLDAQHLADTTSELAKARDAAGKVRAQSMVDSAAATAKQHAQEKKRWEDQVAIERVGQLNLIKVQTQDFIEKSNLEQEDFRLRIARELELSQLDAVTAAGRAARYDSEIKYNKEIIKQKVEIADLDRALARADYDSAGAIIEQIKAREAAIAQLEAAKEANASLAEQTASSAEQIKRSWDYGAAAGVRGYLDEVTNAARKSRDLIGGALKSLEDMLTKFFETGKLSAADFVNFLKQQLAKLASQNIMGGFTQAAAGMFGMGGPQASGGSGGLGGLSMPNGGMLQQGYNMLSSYLIAPGFGAGVTGGVTGSLSGGLANGVGQYAIANPLTGVSSYVGLSGSTVGSGVSGAASTAGSWINGASGIWGAGAGLAGGMLGGALFNNKGYSSLGGSLGAVGGLAVAGSSAVAGTAIGAQLGSVVPVVGTIAGAVLGAAIGSLFGGGGETRYGAGYNVNGGKATKGGGPSGGDPAANDVIRSIESTYSSLQTLTERFGGSTDALTGYRAGWEVSPKKGRSFVFAGLGQDNRVDLQGEKDPAKVLEAFQLQLQRSVIQGLQKANLEDPYNQLVNSVDASKLDSAGVQAILDTLESLHKFVEVIRTMPFKNFADLSATASLSLAKAAGGMDALVSSLQAYYDAYYTDAEKLASSQQNLIKQFNALNVALPASKEQFRALMESIDLSTTSGQGLYAALLSIAPTFAQVMDAAKASADALNTFKKSVEEFQKSLLLSDVSTLSPEQKYAEAKRQYEQTSAAAAAGDATAQSAWTQIAQAFLEASRAYYASTSQYAADFNKVQGYRVDGSHASGLDYVPKDGYIAELHRGEAVLTASDAARYRASSGGASAKSDSEVAAELRALRATIVAQHQQSMRVEAAKSQGSAAAREEAKEGNKQLVKTMRQVMEQL